MSLGLAQVSQGAKEVATSTAARFKEKLADQPWLKVFDNATASSYAPLSAKISGHRPEELTGAIYRTGPAHFERAGHRYDHWFDGDGLVQNWRFNGDGVRHQARLIATAKYLREETAGKHILDGFGTHIGAEPVSDPDEINTANTAMVSHANEVWALWEGGSAYAINKDSLETTGPKVFTPETAGVAFSAHPRIDQQGNLWNFGTISHLSKIVLWQISKTGELNQIQLVDMERPAMVHDFVVTESHIVLLLAPLWYDISMASENSFLDSHVWHPNESSQLLVISKNDLSDHFTCELPAQWVFHYSNAWEVGSSIHFEGCAYRDPTILTGFFREIMHGTTIDITLIGSNLTRYSIDLKTRQASQEEIVERSNNVEFPAFNRRLGAARHRWLNLLGTSGELDLENGHGLLNTLLRVDLESGAIQQFRYSDDEIPEEHLFIPDRHKSDEDAGWVVGTSIDWKQNQIKLSVFHPHGIADGPLATATVDRLTPFALHATYV